jgi:hypothetical protein
VIYQASSKDLYESRRSARTTFVNRLVHRNDMQNGTQNNTQFQTCL